MPHVYTDARPRVSNVGDCNTLKLFLDYVITTLTLNPRLSTREGKSHKVEGANGK